MFGLSTELITKGKLVTVKRFECFAMMKGLMLETSALESLDGCQFIKSADKPNICLLLIFSSSFDWLKAFSALVLIGQNDYFEFV